MKIENNIVYNNVNYPKDVKDVYQYAVDNNLDGYSAYSPDGRYFKWNSSLSKAELSNTKIIKLKEAENINVRKVDVSKQTKSERNTDNVKNVRNKINFYKEKILNLSNTIASLGADKSKLEEKVKLLESKIVEKDSKIQEYEDKVNNLTKQNEELQADIDVIVNLD